MDIRVLSFGALRDLKKNVDHRIKYLKILRESFYVNDDGSRFHNTIQELRKKRFEIKDDLLVLSLEFDNLEALDCEIKDLENYSKIILEIIGNN